jgi:hypothetical protein
MLLFDRLSGSSEKRGKKIKKLGWQTESEDDRLRVEKA